MGPLFQFFQLTLSVRFCLGLRLAVWAARMRTRCILGQVRWSSTHAIVRTIRESVIESCFHMGSESLVAGIIKGLTPIHVIVVLHDILFFQKLGANLVCDLLEGTILVDAHDMPLHVQVGAPWAWCSVAPPKALMPPKIPPSGRILHPNISWQPWRWLLQRGQSGHMRTPKRSARSFTWTL